MASSLVATWHPLRAPAFRRRSHNRRSISVSVSRCALDERTVIESYNSLNGNGNGKGIRYEDTAKESTNGKFDVNLENSSNGNGRLVKYETANGVAFKSGNEQAEERERKKRIEEIGREDAWFKADGGQQPQVNSFQFESHNASGYPILVFNIQYFKSNNFQYFKSSWNSAPPTAIEIEILNMVTIEIVMSVCIQYGYRLKQSQLEVHLSLCKVLLRHGNSVCGGEG
jgi:hypothetical protein